MACVDSLSTSRLHQAFLEPAPQPAISPEKEQNTLQDIQEQFLQGRISIDDVLLKVLMHFCKSHTSRLELQKKLMIAEDKWVEIQEKARLLIATKELEQSSRVQICNKVHNGTAMAALTTSALAVLLSSPTPLAFVGAGVGALLAIDTICDDAAKKYIASWIAQ